MSESIKKSKKSKCSMCENLFEKEVLTLKSNKKYCPACLIIREQEIQSNKSEWNLLFDYICELYKLDKPNGMMFQQMKNYRQEYDYTNIGMYYTLLYYYKVLENEVVDGTGLGIIPYFYEKAKYHYSKVFDIEDKTDNFENTERIVTIKTKLLKKDLPKREPLPLKIDWEEVNEGD
jgi:hypothetical protein